MDKYFDRVTIELSDSEDDGEEVQKEWVPHSSQSNARSYIVSNNCLRLCYFSVVYQLKDRYKDRPLPYLIGTKEWHEKWHIGLAEDENEESDDEDKGGSGDDASLSSSPAMSVSSNVPLSLSESENPTGGNRPRKSGLSHWLNLTGFFIQIW